MFKRKIKAKSQPKYPKFKIKLTFLGYTFIATCVGVGIASMNTGNNLLYLTFSMMLSFIVLSGVLSNTTLYNVKLVFLNQPRFFAQETSNAPVALINQKSRFSSYAVNLAPIASAHNLDFENVDLHDAQKSFVLKILPKAQVQSYANFAFSKRGFCQFPDFNLETYFPFGLLKKYIQIETDASVLVFPKKLESQQLIHFNQNLIGTLVSQRKNVSGNPSGLREYVQGDHYKNIHWKSSAKTLSLRVKEFETEESKDVGIHLILQKNQAHSSDKNHQLVEHALSYVCSLLLELKKNNISCFVKINNQNKMRSSHGIDAILKSLALYDHEQDSVENFNFSQLKAKQTSIVVSNLNKLVFSSFENLHIIAADTLGALS
ncbi:DUF58 domain-containing protein [bacterium]|nr:DUF58 domain-containing protein [bacterium]